MILLVHRDDGTVEEAQVEIIDVETGEVYENEDIAWEVMGFIPQWNEFQLWEVIYGIDTKTETLR